MLLKRIIYTALICILSVIILISGNGCANIIPPTGGPRDSLPPILLRVTPEDSTLNFKDNRINFYFDEYVDVQNTQENLIVSPNPKVVPVVEYKLRTVTVRIKDTLEPNTTYSINFGNAIRDINEGNILKDFTYVFSTGNTLDNNQLAGSILIAETGKVDSTMVVLLHRSTDDSAVIKERPRYVAKLDGSGNFNFRNLPAGSFQLYALKDEGGTRRYISGSQLFAFADKPVIVNDSTRPVTLYAYAEFIEPPRRTATVTASVKEKNNQDKRLTFQTSLDNGQQELLSPFELQFVNPLKSFDSSAVSFTDITYTPLSNYSLSMDSLNKKVSLTYAWQPDSTYRVILDKNVAEDSTGRKLIRIDTISFKVKKISDYGSLRLRFPTLDLNRKPVLQMVQGDKVVFSYPFTTKEFYNKLFKPGDYEVRILYDENQNGKWDAGEFFKEHRQPEKAQAIDRKVMVKNNWDNDVTIEF
ncbi:MAG: Ig-like domain-containing protein [Chitinophagaceae bacterium]